MIKKKFWHGKLQRLACLDPSPKTRNVKTEICLLLYFHSTSSRHQTSEINLHSGFHSTNNSPPITPSRYASPSTKTSFFFPVPFRRNGTFPFSNTHNSSPRIYKNEPYPISISEVRKRECSYEVWFAWRNRV
jgi:hypothetical protein